MMDLIRIKVREDFGKEIYFQILNIKKWSLLQFSFSWNDYPGWPYVQMTFGSNGFFSIMLWVYKFGLDIDILSRTWKWND
jgi:hypothetical protein